MYSTLVVQKQKWSEPSFVHLKWCFEFRMQKTFCYIADFNVFNKCNMQIKCSVYWVFKLKCTFHKYSFKRKHHFVYTNTLSVCQKLMYKYILTHFLKLNCSFVEIFGSICVQNLTRFVFSQFKIFLKQKPMLLITMIVLQFSK